MEELWKNEANQIGVPYVPMSCAVMLKNLESEVDEDDEVSLSQASQSAVVYHFCH